MKTPKKEIQNKNKKAQPNNAAATARNRIQTATPIPQSEFLNSKLGIFCLISQGVSACRDPSRDIREPKLSLFLVELMGCNIALELNDICKAESQCSRVEGLGRENDKKDIFATFHKALVKRPITVDDS